MENKQNCTLNDNLFISQGSRWKKKFWRYFQERKKMPQHDKGLVQRLCKG